MHPIDDYQGLWVAVLDGDAIGWGLSREHATQRYRQWNDLTHEDDARVELLRARVPRGQVLPWLALLGMGLSPTRPPEARRVA